MPTSRSDVPRPELLRNAALRRTDDVFSQFSCFNYPPSDYQRPRFPSLCWPPHTCVIYTLYDSWRFTLIWTLILFTGFHLSTTAIALLMQVGKPSSIWKNLIAVPIVYAVVAGVEALVAGSVVGSV
ncbi:hypothetical protein F4802DRAFT_364565 [Xylaria palmicola]|nr:hypothetical protein F4802DRAFT_364565 [Xylaria palmicola]